MRKFFTRTKAKAQAKMIQIAVLLTARRGENFVDSGVKILIAVVIKPDGEEEVELPETVTLLVTPVQANILAELEAEGEIHVALVYRGTAENAQKFISAQETLLEELTSEDGEEKSKGTEGTAQEKELQGETAEKKYESEKPEIEAVVITPEVMTETTAETEETEVTTNAESV